MKLALLLEDSISRFRFLQSCLGLAGCLCVLYAVFTPFWLKDGGLWAEWNDTDSGQMSEKDVFSGKSRLLVTWFMFACRQQLTEGVRARVFGGGGGRSGVDAAGQVSVSAVKSTCFLFWASLRGDLLHVPRHLMGGGGGRDEGTSHLGERKIAREFLAFCKQV